MTDANLTERELRIVLQARAQSRVEADEWERRSQRLKAIHHGKKNTNNDERARLSFRIESGNQPEQTRGANA